MATRVIIISARVGGLALAQGLRRRQIDFALFERDPELDSRLQGYRTKIVGEAIAKLRSLLTEQAWTEFEATCAETHLGETNLNATSGSIISSREGNLLKGAPLPYTVDRGMLRHALMKGIEEFVHFGKEFSAYEIQPGGNGVSVSFEDGTVETGTLLVGADGARSKVRKHFLPDRRFIDTKTCCIYGKSPISPDLLARFPPEHRKWMTVVLDYTPIIQEIITGEKTIALVSEHVRFPNRSQRTDLPADYIHWGIMFNRNTIALGDDEFEEELRRRPDTLALQIASQWHPSIKSLLELQDTSLTSGMQIVSANPKLPPWTPSANVTLMGDAIHIMSPSGGVGAVAALHDAFVLAQTVSEGSVSADSIGMFEKNMMDYAGVCISRSWMAGKRMTNQPPVENCLEVDL